MMMKVMVEMMVVSNSFWWFVCKKNVILCWNIVDCGLNLPTVVIVIWFSIIMVRIRWLWWWTPVLWLSVNKVLDLYSFMIHHWIFIDLRNNMMILIDMLIILLCNNNGHYVWLWWLLRYICLNFSDLNLVIIF